MNIFTTLAQTSSYYYTTTEPLFPETTPAEQATAIAFFMMTFFVLFFIFFAIAYVFFAVCLMRIFKKADVPQWIAWVPFYNTWKMLEIGGQQGFWAVLAVIPIVNIVSAIFLYIAQYHIGKKLGKGGEFVIWAIVVPFIWYIWLAFDKSKWDDKASTAPSLHKTAA